MPSSGNKINSFVANVNNGVINFATDVIKILLTNTAPIATNTVKANLVEIATGNGYAAGGPAITLVSSAQVSGTYRYIGSNVTITAAGGTIGPFRYLALYDDTPTSPADPLILWYDYGSNLTLNDGDAFTVSFDQTNGILSVT